MKAALHQADPTAKPACEQDRYSQSDSALSARVRSVLAAGQDRLLTLEEVAGQLHLSTRTLKRRLQEEGLNFRILVDRVLCERATQMLQKEGLSVSEVAFRLGYNDVSNFSRAFRRWTGKSPSDFRKG